MDKHIEGVCVYRGVHLQLYVCDMDNIYVCIWHNSRRLPGMGPINATANENETKRNVL